ncbi:MAG: TolC family protein [Flavobacteriales bacterium]|jgi:outer membrane protein|nr:TolC family protein [Flavobacteriales bacterium]
MKKIGILAFVFLLGFTSYAQNKKWTLEEAVAYAIENNISVKQSELDLRLTEINKKDAIGNFLPNLNGSASISSNTGANINPLTNTIEVNTFASLTTGFQSNVTLFDGLRNVRQLQRSKLEIVASQYNLAKMKDDIALFVANAYLQVLFNKENLKVLKAQNEITKEQLNRTNELVDAGVVPRGDLLEIKSTAASEEQRIVIAENQITISLISLAQTLLIKDYENFEVVDSEYELPMSTILEQSVYDIIEKAKQERVEVKIADQNVELAEKDLQITRGGYYPTLSAFAGYNTRWSDNDFFNRNFFAQLDENYGTFLGVQIQVPVFNGFAVRNNVERSKINIVRANLQKEQADLDIEANVYQAYTDAKGALKAYEAALVAEEAQLQAYEYSQSRFDVGFLNSFDFSQSKLRLENAQSEVIRTKYDYIFKLKLLELYFGISLY